MPQKTFSVLRKGIYESDSLMAEHEVHKARTPCASELRDARPAGAFVIVQNVHEEAAFFAFARRLRCVITVVMTPCLRVICEI